MTFLRSALFNVFFFSLSFVLTLVAWVAQFVSADAILGVAMLWSRILVPTLRIVCGIRVEVVGLENLPTGPVIVASRHQSAFDTFIWLTLVPRCCYVFKKELLKIPAFGPLIQKSGMIPVDRDGGAAAIRALMREADRAVRENRQIVIFPEGTRTEPGQRLALQAGIAAVASHTGLPVIPVSTDSGKCWGRRAFRKEAGTIHIVIGSPIPGGTDRKTLMRSLETGMAATGRV